MATKIDSIVNLESIDVDKTKSQFDYSRWLEESTVELHRVNWDFDYTNVVNWSADLLPRVWFNGRPTDEKMVLDGFHRLKPHTHSGGVLSIGTIEGSFRIDLPFEQVVDYKYCRMINGVSPVDGTTEHDKNEWYYFIKDFVPISPSVTEIVVELDVWTNFFDRIDVRSVLLERGHAAMQTTVAEFLNNPAENNMGLDVVEDPDLVHTRAKVTQKWDYSQDQTAVVCADVYPYAIEVIDNTAVSGDVRYPSTMGVDSIDQKVYFSLPLDQIQQLRLLNPLYPKLVHGIFICPTSMLVSGVPVQVSKPGGGVLTYTPIVPRSQELIEPIHLNKDDFAYPARYAEITKLYCSPYAILEIRDGDATFDVRVQDLTPSTALYANVDFSFPFLKLLPEVIGIAGSQVLTRSYDVEVQTITKVTSSGRTIRFPKDLPVYGLTVSAKDAYVRDSYGRWLTQSNREIDYQNAMLAATTAEATAERTSVTSRAIKGRDAVKARDNANASRETEYGNVGRSLTTAQTVGDRNALTTKTNEYRSLDLAKANVDYSADQGLLSAKHAADVTKVVTDNSSYVARTNASATAEASRAAGLGSAATSLANANASALTARDNGNRQATAAYNNAGASIAEDLSTSARENANVQALTTIQNSANDDAAVYGLRQARLGMEASIVQAEENQNAANTLSWAINAETLLHLIPTISLPDSGSAGSGSSTSSGTEISGRVASRKGDIAPSSKMSRSYSASFDAFLGHGLVAGIGGVPYANARLNNYRILERTLRDININYVDDTTKLENQTLNRSTAEQVSQNNDNYGYRTTRANAHRNTNLSTANTNNGATYSTSTGNATRSNATDVANTNRSADTAINVADATRNVAITNAETIRNKEYTNAQRTCDTTKYNAARSCTTGKTTADAAYNNAIENNAWVYNTGNTNRQATNTTTAANITRDYNTTVADATDVRATEEANIDAVYDTAVEIANNNLQRLDNEFVAAYNAAGLQNNEQGGLRRISEVESLTGGTQVILRTLSPDNVTRIGERFMRRGYLWNGPVDWEPIPPNRTYSYWQVDQVVVRAPRCPSSVAIKVQNILRQGVTFWSDPETVGDYV